MSKKLLVEFIGTFFLVLTVGLSVFSGNPSVIPPIAIGFVLMVMVYAGGHVSGAHYNPAVSLAAAIRGALSWKDLLPYWIVQFLGAGIAALVVIFCVEVPECIGVGIDVPLLMGAEILFTFALCYVVLHTATSKDTEGNSYFGFAIGATVTVGAFATAGLCLGAFNPAVALGLLSMGAACMPLFILTVIANLIGGALAGYVYKLTANE